MRGIYLARLKDEQLLCAVKPEIVSIMIRDTA